MRVRERERERQRERERKIERGRERLTYERMYMWRLRVERIKNYNYMCPLGVERMHRCAILTVLVVLYKPSYELICLYFLKHFIQIKILTQTKTPHSTQ